MRSKMASESKLKVIAVEKDQTGRARCKESSCLQKIEKGDARVGAPMFAQGRTVTAWFHPNCFISGVMVEECQKGNGGKCKISKAKFGKGDFRALIRCGSAKFGLGLKPAKRLLQPVLETIELNFSDINGAKDLPEKYSIEWNEERVKRLPPEDDSNVMKRSAPDASETMNIQSQIKKKR